MKIHKLEIQVKEYEDQEELNEQDQVLLRYAEEAVKGSYAPYSEFHVGAAVLLENGEIVLGSNQENSAYPSGLCAERTALFYAQSKYPGVAVKAIAITAKAEHFVVKKPITPCGACRQVMAETESRQQDKIKIIMAGERSPVLVTEGIDSLLPLVFQEDSLKKKK
jgi:cytidine deaminase